PGCTAPRLSHHPGVHCRGISRLTVLREEPAVRGDPDTLLVQPLADQELEGRPGAPPGVEHAVDLPFSQERVVLLARLRPVGELRQPSELSRKLRPLLDGPLEALLPHRYVEPGL